MSDRILVTGATGFLGQRLARALAERGERLRLLARRVEALPKLDGDVEIVEADLVDPACWDRALDGCRRVYHLAALVKKWVPDRKLFDRVNVGAVERLLERAPAHGVDRVVLTSSFFALGPSTEVAGPVSEEHRSESTPHNDYERTKRALEPIVSDHVRRGAVEVVTTYPGVIYGPGELTEGNILVKTFRDYLAGKLPGIPGSGKQLWSYAFVEDVVEGHRLAMEKGRPGGRYILGGENVTVDHVFSEFARLSGKKPLTRHLPIGLLLGVGAGEEMLAWLFGREPELTRGVARIYAHDWAYSSERAKAELGYRCRPFQEGLEETWAWMQREGLAG
ncbi:MAG: NAD-dependent epimerase/dehydratase family protein [Planctomycetota bacterium]